MLSRRSWFTRLLCAFGVIQYTRASAQTGGLIQIFGDENYEGPVFSSNTSINRYRFNDTMTSFHLAHGKSVIFYIDVDYRYELFQNCFLPPPASVRYPFA